MKKQILNWIFIFSQLIFILKTYAQVFPTKNSSEIYKPNILSISPTFNEITSSSNPKISVTFDISMDSTSFNSLTFWVMGERSADHTGEIIYDEGNKTVAFNSLNKFSAGERVQITLSKNIKSAKGDFFNGFSWQFKIPSKKVGLNFSKPVEYGGGGYEMQCIDMNNDGSPDIVTSSGVILLNNGKGEFPSYWYLDDADGESIIVDDFNRDGYMDVFYSGTNGLTLGLGDGAGNFAESYYPWWFLGYIGADINSDGYSDLVGFNSPASDTTSYWGIALNDDTGHFNDTTWAGQLTGEFAGISYADVDNDGNIDILIISQHTVTGPAIFSGLEGLAVFKNNGNGFYNKYQLYPSCNNFPGFPKYIYSSDFNNDNLTDIAVLGYTGGIALNKGDGIYGECFDTTYIRAFWGPEVGGVSTYGDVNGDGWVDIAVSGSHFPPEMPITSYTVFINYESKFLNNQGFYDYFTDTLPDAYIYSNALADLDGDGDLDIVHSGTGVFVTLNKDTITSVTDFSEELKEFRLCQNYPNPFNPSTTIEYTISKISFVTIKVYDVLGNEIETLVNGERSEGIYKVDFNASKYASGIYFYQLKTNGLVLTKKMILLR